MGRKFSLRFGKYIMYLNLQIFFLSIFKPYKEFFLIVLKRKYMDEKLKFFNNLCMKIDFFFFFKFKEKKVKHFQ